VSLIIKTSYLDSHITVEVTCVRQSKSSVDVLCMLQGTRHKVKYDGMMHYLEIPRARETDGGQVRVVARNTEGEAEASTTLNIIPHDDWRSKLRQAPKGIG